MEETGGLKIPEGLPEGFIQTPDTGLTDEEAARLKESGQSNFSRADEGKSAGKILLGNLFTFFNMLNFALAACLMLVGSYKNMLFMGVVFSNTLIGTVQELRAKETIKKLKIASRDKCEVIRNGKKALLDPDELVKGDLVRLSRGCQVPADAIVVSGSAALNEALITGESVSIPKQKGDWALSASFVTEGSVVCQLALVGDESYVNRLTRDARKQSAAKSRLMSDLDRLIKYLTVVLVPMGLLLFAKEYFLRHEALKTAVPEAVAAMIGMIPEGLMLLTSVALMVGVVRLGRKGALVQELYGIETLARSNVLCLDKTGTLTTGELSVSEIIPADANEDEAKAAISRYLGAFPNENSGTVLALKRFVPAGSEAPIRIIDFSSERKLSAASFAGGKTLILGAPSFVLKDNYTGEIKRLCEQSAGAGKRVLMLCEANGEIDKTETLPIIYRNLCLIVLEDTIRENAAETLDRFASEGVEIKIISGDDPLTVSAIGRRLKLQGCDRYVDVSLIKTDEEVAALADKYVVFGRVSPERKRVLVKALKAAGKSVAMTGDGVNDIPALRSADCSICMAGGTEAAKHASQLTLVASDFTALPAVVAEGRRAVNNVTRAASLFLVKTLYSFFLCLTMLVLPAKYPFQPIQLTLISSFTVGIPSFFLSLEPNKARIKGDFIKTIVKNALPSALAVTACALTVMLGHDDSAVASTLATLSAAFVGIITLIKLCLPMNKARAVMITLMTLCVTICACFFGSVFSLSRLSTNSLMTLAGLCLLGCTVMGLSAIFMKKVLKKEE